MGNLSDWSIWKNTEEKKCGNCGMDKEETTNNGCCKDEHKWVKIEDDQKVNFVQETPTFAAAESNHLTGYILIKPNFVSLAPISNAHFRRGDIAVYKFNCNFRI